MRPEDLPAARDPNDAILALRDVAVRAGDRTLMKDLDLTVAAGELVAITGPSGSGKTMLLRTIAGLQAGDGAVTLRGRAPAAYGWPCFRRQVLLVDQQPVLLAGSVADNLQRPFSYKRVDAAFDAKRARRLIERAGLAEVDLDSAAQELSVGQQQRVCLVRALLLDAAILLLDEPTASLDEAAVAQIEELVVGEVKPDAGALIVTHNPLQARRWCDRQVDLTDYLTETVSDTTEAAS